MSQIRDGERAALPPEVEQQIDALCEEFRAALKLGGRPPLESYVARVDPRGREFLRYELTLLAMYELPGAGAADSPGEIPAEQRSPRLELKTEARANAPTISGRGGERKSGVGSGLVVRCPHCLQTIDLIVDASLIEIDCSHCGGRFSLVNDAETTHDAAALTRVAHFELVERLGMGEFGTVWKARDTLLDRTVALKIPRRELLDPYSTEKFMREARAAAQLRHPNIVSTYEVGRDGDTHYIVNECIRGVSLAEMAADHRLDVRESVTLVAKVADALDHAHRAGVIHRDLKPSNILIDDAGEPHLTDFGLAKRNEREITITTEGAILGTPAYMSPEQARGESHEVDGRSDIYSLGVILFHLLTGDLPFRGSTRMLLHRVINDDPPGPRTLDARVPKDLDTICLKCLEKEPARRYAVAADVAADLRRFLAGEPVLARRLGAWGRSLRWARRNRAVAALLAATIATLLGATLVSTYFGWRAAENAARADQQAAAVTDALYDSLLDELESTREVRRQGYGDDVRQLVTQATQLGSRRFDPDDVRRQLVLTMGDFLAYAPTVITPPDGQPSSIVLNDDGSTLVVGLSNGRLLMYDVAAGRMRDELKGLAAEVQAIAFSAAEDQMVAADEDGTACVWRRAGNSWELKQTLALGVGSQSVFVSAEGEMIAWLKGSVLDVWDVAAGARLRSLDTEPDWVVRNAVFDVSNRSLAGGYHDEKTDTVGWAIWDLDTGERRHVSQMSSLGKTYANGVDVNSEVGRLAIGFDEALLVYALDGFDKSTLYGIDSTKAVAFSPASPYLAVANIRGRITLLNSETNHPLATLYHPRPGLSRDDLAFSGDGTRLAASNAESIQIWDLTSGDERTVITGHRGGIPTAVFHPDGSLLATGGKDDEVRFWNPATGKLVRRFNIGEAVQSLAYSPDRRLLAVGSLGRLDAPHVRVFDVESQEAIHTASLAMGHVHSLAWCDRSDGRRLAACGLHGVAMWKVSDAPFELENVFEIAREWCLAALFSPDGRWLAWVQDNQHLHAWDVDRGRERPLHAPPLLQGWHGIAFLPGGSQVAYIAATGAAEVWDVEHDRHVDSFGAPGVFKSPHIAVSPDGKWFAALVEQDMVSVWHLPSKEHVFSLRPETGSVWSLAWDPSGEQLAVGQSDGGLAIWRLPKIQQKLAEFDLQWHEDQ